MLQEQVLALLRTGGGVYRSGEAMSRTLGVSRAAVWKAVEGLRQDGYIISSVSNRGYRLDAGPDQLRAGALSGALTGRLLGQTLVCLERVDSTNSEVKRRATLGVPEGLVVLADEQTGGRGRRGNTFQSLCGQGLYLSLLLRPRFSLRQLSELTAWTAVAVCRGIGACCGAEVGIKWTNDLILGGKKLGGILTELEFEGESNELVSVVVGIGVNTGQTAEDFGPELSKIATSLAMVPGRPVGRAELAGHILQAMDDMYRAFPAEKSAYWGEYRRRCVTIGHRVVLLRGDGPQPAFAEDIDQEFALVVRLPDGRQETVNAGEVSVRGLMGYVEG